jgi:hypothetical protein
VADVIAACNQAYDDEDEEADDSQASTAKTSTPGGTAPIFDVAA